LHVTAWRERARAHLRLPAFAAGLRRSPSEWRLVAGVAAVLGALAFLIWAVTGPQPTPMAPPPLDSAVEAVPVATEPMTPRLETVRITVHGGSALVYREGRFLNGTPLELREQVGERVRLRLERAGYQPLQVEFTVTAGKTEYEFELSPLPSPTVPQDAPGGAALGALLMMPFGWLGRRRRAGAREETGGAVASQPTGRVACVDAALRVEAAVLSDPGCVREVNEDCIRVVSPGTRAEQERRGYLAVVADGMGGHLAGEIASRLAVDEVEKSYAADDGDPTQALVRALRRAHGAIRQASRADPTLQGMGTTCTALAIRGGLAFCAHVGDSRLYLARAGELLQMTEDHSAVMDLVRRGLLARAEAKHHPDRNVILQALGSREDLDVSVWPRPFALRPGDRFILCSDGLHDLVEEEELLARVSQCGPATACRQLIALARERGAPDNVSVAVLAVHAADEPGLDPAALRQTRAGEEAAP
jgi:protein phosphatase